MKEVAIWVWIGWIKWILWVIYLHQGEGEQEGLGDGDPPHDLSRRGDVPPSRLAHDHLRYCRAPRPWSCRGQRGRLHGESHAGRRRRPRYSLRPARSTD